MPSSDQPTTAAGWPINWNCAPVAPFVGVRRWLNIWRLRYVIDGGVYVEVLSDPQARHRDPSERED